MYVGEQARRAHAHFVSIRKEMPTCEFCGRQYVKSHKKCARRDVTLARVARENQQLREAEKVRRHENFMQILGAVSSEVRTLVTHLTDQIVAVRSDLEEVKEQLAINANAESDDWNRQWLYGV